MDWSRFSHMPLTDFLLSRRTLILVLMAVILYQVTGIFYKVLQIEFIQTKPVPVASEKIRAATAPMRESADMYRIIVERNLFGTTTKALTEKQVATAVQPQQDVGLLIELKGTVAGDAQYGFAVVEEKGTKKQRLVKAGDLIAGAKVVRVRRNAVDLIVNNQERILKMAEMKEEPIVPPAAIRPTATTAAVPGRPTIVSRAEIEAGLQDMGSMLRQAQVRPYFTAGAPDGFMISQIRPDSLYRKMGIMDGDVIQEVNNRRIQTADDLMGLLNIVKSGSSMSLTIKRRGNQETLNYQFQ